MNTVIVACLVVITVSVAVAVVYLVLTLIQMRRTAEQAEALLEMVNSETKKIEHVGHSIASALSSFAVTAASFRVPAMMKIVIGAVGALAGFALRRPKSDKSRCDGQKPDSDDKCCR